MSKRDRARRRRHRVQEVDEQFGPDPSEIILTFPDGWTIRRPGSIVGLIREGILLDNCLRYCDDALHPDGIDPDEIGRLAGHMYSLRDRSNVPHACFVHAAARLHWPGCTTDVLGFANTQVKAEYLERIEAWHHTLPYPTALVLRSDDIRAARRRPRAVRGMKARHTYTPAEVDTALLVLALTGRNSVVAARRLKDEGLEINPRTLRSWREHTHATRYIEIEHQHAPEIERQMISQARAIVTAANEGTLEAIDAAREQLRNGEAKDPSTVARNLSTSAGIMTDKALLLEGRPTEIRGGDNLEAALERIAQRLGLPQSVDSTAEEIEAELPAADVASAHGGNEVDSGGSRAAYEGA